MAASPQLQVQWSGDAGSRDGSPLVVALHGRGADERSFTGLERSLPTGVIVAAVRAPIAEGGGYAWFRNRGIGRPVAESIAETAGLLLDWLEEAAQRHPTVCLLGFSGGMAMAGGLLMAEPSRFQAAILLSGTLPWDAGLPEQPGRLDGLPVFWGRDLADPVIPADLIDRTGTWLREKSGARLTERHYPDLGHRISSQELGDVRDFLLPVLGRR